MGPNISTDHFWAYIVQQSQNVVGTQDINKCMSEWMSDLLYLFHVQLWT